MLNNNIRRLLVLEDGKLVGVITHFELSNKSIFPEFTPLFSVPAIGCEPINKS